MDQPSAVAFIAFADAWPRAIETEIGAALCATGRGKGLGLFIENNHKYLIEVRALITWIFAVLVPLVAFFLAICHRI